jgi:uncharacterized iron-regulated protein/outer membrane lipoprotein-sorting protein
MERQILALIFVLIMAAAANSQITLTDTMYRVYDGQGNPVTLDAIVKAMAANDAVFLGEQHDDSVAHAIEAELFRRAVSTYSPQRKVALSMEMFERDVQVVVDEYLGGLISEQHFLLSSRPWPNYKTDYRPLVEFAKEKHLDVVAANAPRRYVNMVSRNGRESLNALSDQAKSWLAPLPYPEPSDAYKTKFNNLMAGNTADPSRMSPNAATNLIYSQSLWDATMGNSVANYLKNNKGALVVHLNGGFHTESRLGTIEQLIHYRSKTKAIVVTMQSEDDITKFDQAKHKGLGDFVILTAAKVKTPSLLREILQRVQAQHQSIESLKANVKMTRYNSQLKDSDTYSGNVSYLPKSDRRSMYVRLNWEKPAVDQLLVIGDRYSFYQPRLNVIVQGSLAKVSVSRAPSNVLGFMSMSTAQLTDEYAINYVGRDSIDGTDLWHLEVTPRSTASYKSAELWIDNVGLPRQAKVYEQNGDTTTVSLTNVQKNITISAETFRLQYPAGVKMIRP